MPKLTETIKSPKDFIAFSSFGIIQPQSGYSSAHKQYGRSTLGENRALQAPRISSNKSSDQRVTNTIRCMQQDFYCMKYIIHLSKFFIYRIQVRLCKTIFSQQNALCQLTYADTFETHIHMSSTLCVPHQ